MRDMTPIDGALIDTVRYVSQHLRPNGSPVVLLSGDVNVCDLLFTNSNDTQIADWFRAVVGSGYSRVMSTARHRSDCINGSYAYAAGIALSKSKPVGGKAPALVQERIASALRDALSEATTSVVTPGGFADQSDTTIGRNILIVSCLYRPKRRKGSKPDFSDRLWAAASEQFCGYDLQQLGQAENSISQAPGWKIAGRWGSLNAEN